MTFTRLVCVTLCLDGASCAKVRDFGCLSNADWVAAPSHVEIGIQDRQSTTILERNVLRIGLENAFIVAECKRSPDDTADPLPGDKPCGGFNIVDSASGQIWHGLSETSARKILEEAGARMPDLHYAGKWFNQDWPDGNPADSCKASFPQNPVPRP